MYLIKKINHQEGLPNVQEHVAVLVKGVDVDGNSTIDYNVRSLAVFAVSFLFSLSLSLLVLIYLPLVALALLPLGARPRLARRMAAPPPTD